VGVDELLEHGAVLAEQNVIGQEHRAGLALDQAACRPDGVTQAPRLLLLDVCDHRAIAQLVDLGQDLEEVALVALGEVMLELDRAVEVAGALRVLMPPTPTAKPGSERS